MTNSVINIKQRHNYKGFTLIEMMIVVAVIGVLAAIAYPNYQRYVIKTKRTDMMTQLQNIASQIQAKKLSLGSYKAIATSTLELGNYPRQGGALYRVSISPTKTDTTDNVEKLDGANWSLTATPITGLQMATDGVLTLNAQGLKCRDKNNNGVTTDTGECGVGNEWQE